MSWRDTWRETVESFLREVRGTDAEPPRIPEDPLVSAIAAGRAEASALERELETTAGRMANEQRAAADCERRRELAGRIGDHDTARIAARFGRRHAERAEVLTRKHAVLRDELALSYRALDDLLELARAEPRAAGSEREQS